MLHMFLHKGDIFVIQLLLQRFVGGADDSHLARTHQRQEVGLTFPNACGSFYKGMPACSQGLGDRHRHLDLRGPLLIAWQSLR